MEGRYGCISIDFFVCATGKYFMDNLSLIALPLTKSRICDFLLLFGIRKAYFRLYLVAWVNSFKMVDFSFHLTFL
jgi:hypothetical protein